MVEEMRAAQGIAVRCETVRRRAIDSAEGSPVGSAEGPQRVGVRSYGVARNVRSRARRMI